MFPEMWFTNSIIKSQEFPQHLFVTSNIREHHPHGWSKLGSPCWSVQQRSATRLATSLGTARRNRAANKAGAHSQTRQASTSWLLVISLFYSCLCSTIKLFTHTLRHSWWHWQRIVTVYTNADIALLVLADTKHSSTRIKQLMAWSLSVNTADMQLGTTS